MSLVDLIMPKLGESIMEATILRWHKQPGDKVAMDETVLDIATDKVDSEVPSTAEGVIEAILYKENDVVPIGTVIAKIKMGAAQENATPALQPTVTETPKASVEEIPYQPVAAKPQASSGARFYSPLVLNIAQSEGISMAELENIPGTGQDGRVTKKDILAYVANRGKAPVAPSAPASVPPTPTVAPIAPAAVKSEAPINYGSNVEKIGRAHV